ncbi:UDP-glucose 4-epimerase GalE [Synechococcus sp. Cruz-9H2]|uniref:UDP-glucose 4-epimerase GalE n=1 Tax=unclassified Synechococcus TaxID=2626047 RepID=UPI0020CC3507|nr:MULTISPECIES: UDP-glucose 4-epimerase GalE [unclassified Synechococcus]MCP9819892.1 UDP-glucose 4-epimerase GalE [Synechococcus sp. Cruz-9H2]MCP9844198.1 UDP-glucose 4-epimerase GalE [Synechococcus sp. Edmonson 11F2]MCP9856322.1 UDP-glucose 4-epimerase GalE [Synechococcus sp. Cruz-9C9]MCP9863607.1 UDP-glucose 4-epimerase GalE [Synechococcus sp. Cruz-7E5]MCP9870803.1 UDP-glucose 4-epimerase GalE [Synechococcus sp. Cruz-7B9]
MTLLVTGGAGYIGSHTVRALQKAGFKPVVLDNLVYGHRRIVEEVLGVPLVVGQVGDQSLLDQVLSGEHPACDGEPVQAVLHFAAYAYVGESVQDPAKYYRNNLADSLTLLEALVEPVRAGTGPAIPIVFSSTCATYGIPDTVPISEDTPQRPINPYGRSKWMVEQLLTDFGAAYGLPSVIFRYFNAAGADPAGDLGEDHTPETHLIPLVLEAMAGRRSGVEVYGDDYPTPDGTCIRDYIHVCDLADAHVLGLKQLLARGGQHVYNLGNGTGYSVQEVLEAARHVTQRELQVRIAPRREGDPPVLVASADQARLELGWTPEFPDLATIIEQAWSWQQHGAQSSAR